MSQENLEVVRRGLALYGARDESATRSFFEEFVDSEVVFHPALGGLADQSAYRGRDAVLGFIFEDFPGARGGFTGELLEARDLGDDAVLAVVNFHGKVARADVDVAQVFGQIWRFREGRVVEVRSYPSVSEALEAVGLPE